MASAADYRESWYEESMASRERALATRFGPTSPPDQVFKPDDQNWEMTIPGFAFLRYPPSSDRAFWLYLTHGLAQPAELEDFQRGFDGDLSGFGVEFALSTPEEEAWPFRMLEVLASYSLSGSQPVLPGDRIPSSDLMEEARGGNLLALHDPGYPSEVGTLSGTFHIIHLVGATAEIKKAKDYLGDVGSRILELVLREFGVGCVTDRKRPCLTARRDFERVWKRCEAQVGAEEAGEA